MNKIYTIFVGKDKEYMNIFKKKVQKTMSQYLFSVNMNDFSLFLRI